MEQDKVVETIKLLSDSVHLLHDSVKALRQLSIIRETTQGDINISSVVTKGFPQGESQTRKIEHKFDPIPKVEVLSTIQRQKIDEDTVKAFEEYQLVNKSTRLSRVDPWKSLLSKWDISLDEYWHELITAENEEQEREEIQEHKTTVIKGCLEDQTTRTNMQKQLLYALVGRSEEPRASKPRKVCATLDAGPWISLIMLKLPRVIAQSTFPESWKTILMVKRGTMSFGEGISKIGAALDVIYQRGVWEQPAENDFKQWESHAQLLYSGIDPMNIWAARGGLQMRFNGPTSSRELRGVLLSDHYEQYSVDIVSSKFSRSGSPMFKPDHLCLRNLRTVGKLQLKWTEFLSEHLTLDLKSMTLLIYWFGFQIEFSPVSQIACTEYNHINDYLRVENCVAEEIKATYQVLFRSPTEASTADIREYSLLPIPPWMRIFAGDDDGPLSEKVARNMSYFVRKGAPFVSDMDYHLENGRSPVSRIQPFRDYKIFGDNMSILMAYIESQKPGGIRGLWRDRRDNYQWFTFWVVVVFGSFTVIMSFLALGVGIAQAVAGFKALH